MKVRFASAFLCALLLCSCPPWFPAENPIPSTEPSAYPRPTPTPAPEWISITVVGDHFRPALNLRASATVILDYDDGVEPIVLSHGPGDLVLEDRTFVDMAESHEVRLLVQPWSALAVLNLGFRAGDGGNDLANTSVPFVPFHPSTAVPGFEDPSDVLDAQAIQGFVGKVTAISNLQAAADLDALCLEHQAVDELDCSGLSALRTVEAFRSTVKRTNFSGCVSLRRCCLESTGAYRSWRMEGQTVVEDDSLDLRDSPLLQDIRGTNDDHTLLRLHPGALSTLWHLCKMENPRFTAIQVGDEEPAPLDLSRFTGLIQCWLSGSPVLERLALTNRVTQSFWLAGCGVTEIDIHGQVQVYDLEAPGNPLIAVDISGCSGLRTLDLAGCGLDQAQVDSILATMEGFGTMAGAHNAILLGGESSRGLMMLNAPPSSEGMDHADALRSRGWTVVCNVAESPM